MPNGNVDKAWRQLTRKLREERYMEAAQVSGATCLAPVPPGMTHAWSCAQPAPLGRQTPGSGLCTPRRAPNHPHPPPCLVPPHRSECIL